MSKRYWEVETPVVFRSEKNEIRIFNEHGKIQVYPRVEGAAHGVGRGATIDLESMSIEELRELRDLINKAIDAQFDTGIVAS